MASLDEDQADLLIAICEASRRQPKGGKESFEGFSFGEDSFIRHQQLGTGDFAYFHWPDLELLARLGFVTGRQGRGLFTFDVSPAGFEHFEKLMKARGEAVVRLEDTVRRLIDSAAFASTFGEAYNLWRKAEKLYWSDRSGEHASTIGHLCRESMQAFGVAFALACHAQPETSVKTVDNVRAGLFALKGQVSESRLALLDALLPYWGAVIDVVQRQEHGGSKEGDALTVDDSRIAVLQTALVMFELASAVLARAGI